MTATYTIHPRFTANQRPPRPRLRGLGTAHRAGPLWSLSVRSLRAAILAAREHAPAGRATAVTIADQVIDHIDQLTPRDLEVFAVALGILLKASKN
jgi:hypothetical protein